jgi:hypothetical protein
MFEGAPTADTRTKHFTFCPSCSFFLSSFFLAPVLLARRCRRAHRAREGGVVVVEAYQRVS